MLDVAGDLPQNLQLIVRKLVGACYLEDGTKRVDFSGVSELLKRVRISALYAEMAPIKDIWAESVAYDLTVAVLHERGPCPQMLRISAATLGRQAVDDIVYLVDLCTQIAKADGARDWRNSSR